MECGICFSISVNTKLEIVGTILKIILKSKSLFSKKELRACNCQTSMSVSLIWHENLLFTFLHWDVIHQEIWPSGSLFRARSRLKTLKFTTIVFTKINISRWNSTKKKRNKIWWLLNYTITLSLSYTVTKLYSYQVKRLISFTVTKFYGY